MPKKRVVFVAILFYKNVLGVLKLMHCQTNTQIYQIYQQIVLISPKFLQTVLSSYLNRG